jgi:hypothetical protein
LRAQLTLERAQVAAGAELTAGLLSAVSFVFGSELPPAAEPIAPRTMTAMIPEITLAVTGLGSRMVSLRVKKITESITNVVAPTIANLISSWCRSAKGRIAM